MGGTQGNLDTEGPLTVERHGTAGISTVDTIIIGRRPTTRALRIHHTTDMVEGEKVLDAGVDTGLVDKDLLGELLRQGVTDGHVLDTQVSQVGQIIGLRIEVVVTRVGETLDSGVNTAVDERTRILRVRVVLGPVVQLSAKMFICAPAVWVVNREE